MAINFNYLDILANYRALEFSSQYYIIYIDKLLYDIISPIVNIKIDNNCVKQTFISNSHSYIFFVIKIFIYKNADPFIFDR